MKTRESGMPPEDLWHTFFDPDQILAALHLTPGTGTVVDFGCGYGTFALPAARLAQQVYAFDIDPAMVAATRLKARDASLLNLHVIERDFFTQGTGLPAAAADYVMLFNILHAEDPLRLLAEAYRITRPGGALAVIHWNPDTTPRGPTLSIRPTPDQCLAWCREAGWQAPPAAIPLPPYHYGFTATR